MGEPQLTHRLPVLPKIPQGILILSSLFVPNYNYISYCNIIDI